MAPRSTKAQPVNSFKKSTNTSMPPISASNSNKQNFSFDIVAALLLIMRERGITISRTHYELMSALDGNRTADAFQHQFRAVMARAKGLHEQRENGVAFEAVKPMSKSRSKGASNNSTNNKRKKGEWHGDVDGSGVKKTKKQNFDKGLNQIKHQQETDSDEDNARNADAIAGKSPSPADYYRRKASEVHSDDSMASGGADGIKTEPT